MKAIVCSFLVLVFSAVSASSQESLLQPEADEVLIGPVAIESSISGISLVTNASCFASLATVDGALKLDARVIADLGDLQRKFGSLVDTFPLPTNNCASYGVSNVVARVWGKELLVEGGNGIVRLKGDVDVWTCAKNPVPCTRVDWHDERILGAVIRVPKLIAYDCNPPIKNRNVRQPFTATLPFSLTTPDDHTVAIRLGRPDVDLGGSLGGVTDGILRIAGVDINGRIHDALQQAISSDLLQRTLPSDLMNLQPRIKEAALFDNGGSLAARVHVEANVPSALMTELINLLINRPAPTPLATAAGGAE